MLYYFDINTCIVTTVSGVKQHSYAACDAALAPCYIIRILNILFEYFYYLFSFTGNIFIKYHFIV